MSKVFLRARKNAKRGLPFDFYPPVQNPKTGRHTRHEHLKLYVYEKPKTKVENHIIRKLPV